MGFNKVLIGFYWLSSSHILILDFSFDGGTDNFTKSHYNWSPGLISGEFGTIF
jgi:hypothetical protein